MILIPLHCVAHSHDSLTVLNVLLAERSVIEKRNRRRYKNVFFFSLTCIDINSRAYIYTRRPSLSEIEFVYSRQLPTDVRTGNDISVRIEDRF